MEVVPLGQVIDPQRSPWPWMKTHATYPTPVLLGRKIRIFFSSRDDNNRGRPGWCDVRADEPTTVLSISKSAMFGPGLPGAFDDCGISIGNIVKAGTQWRMYYLGWNRPTTTPLHNAIGLATSKTPGSFRRAFTGPLLDRSRADPFSVSYPFVLRSGSGWTMYYGTSRGPGNRAETMDHAITAAHSRDGLTWTPSGKTEIELRKGEVALARPWIVPTRGGPIMLFTSYSKKLRVAFARRSRKGRWERVEDDIVPRSKGPWADDEVCYPSHIRAAGRDYLFYCGNNYGRTGFGVAEIKL